MNPLNWLEKISDAVMPPIDKWVAALRNALHLLGLAFILMFVLAFLLLVGSWGLAPYQRLWVLFGLFALMFVALIIAFILARDPEMPLHTPEERSYRDGKRFGNQQAPKTLEETAGQPAVESTNGSRLSRLPESTESPEDNNG